MSGALYVTTSATHNFWDFHLSQSHSVSQQSLSLRVSVSMQMRGLVSEFVSQLSLSPSLRIASAVSVQQEMALTTHSKVIISQSVPMFLGVLVKL